MDSKRSFYTSQHVVHLHVKAMLFGLDAMVLGSGSDNVDLLRLHEKNRGQQDDTSGHFNLI